jgi:two-component system OmpR family sensor kinase
MTALTAGNTAAGRRHTLRDLSNRTSLRTKLIVGLLALVIAAVAAISISSVWVLRSYLTSQDDNQLRDVYNSVVSSGESQGMTPGVYSVKGVNNIWAWVAEPGTSLSPPSSASGLPYGGSSQVQSVPSVPTSQLWAIANNGKLNTVAAQSGSDTWRVITEPVSFQTASGQQVSGTLVVGADLGNINATVGRLAATVLLIGLIVVCILALAIVMVVRASLRPLLDIEETAGEIAAGHLNRRVPERDPRTEIGSLGRSLNTMLSQIETAFHAQEASETAAHQSEERMRRFVADASHELRTPVTAIRGFAEYFRQRGGLARRPGPDEEAVAAAVTQAGLSSEDVDRIMLRVEKEAARMGLLVEDLLLLARLDQQRPMARQPVDMLTLAADAVHDARLLAPNRTIDLTVQPGAAPLVIGDEPRLRQVIGNLMSNALNHTPDGVPIEISLGTGTLDHHDGNPTPAVVLDVTDQGPGMTQEQARRVFERFYRADQARTRATGGSGLGLAIVAALVAAHGGSASVRTAEGQGATFRITLPLDPDAMGSQLPDDDFDQADPADDAELADAAAETGPDGGTGSVQGTSLQAGQASDQRADEVAGRGADVAEHGADVAEREADVAEREADDAAGVEATDRQSHDANR